MQKELGSRVFSWLALLLPALALTTSRDAGTAEPAIYQRFARYWERTGGFRQIIMFEDIAMTSRVKQ